MPIGSQQNPDTNWTEQLSVGLAFSPNGEILYVISMCNIYQYDLQNGTWYHVAGIDTAYLYFTKYDNCYIGPDSKLYVGNYHGTSKQMSVIDNPDVWGAGCNFCPRCLRLDSLGIYAAAGTPPCMPNYSLGAQECWALGNDELLMLNDELEVWPNPASAMLHVKASPALQRREKELYNFVGQKIYTTKENQIDVRKYAPGVYYIKVGTVVKKIIIE